MFTTQESLNAQPRAYPYETRTLTDTDIRGVLTKRGWKPNRAHAAACAEANLRHAEISAESEKLVFNAAGQDAIAEQVAVASAIADGTKAVSEIDAVAARRDWRAKQYETQSAALRGAIAIVIARARPSVCAIAADALAELELYADELEARDRANCEELGLGVEFSAPAKFVRSCAMFARRMMPAEKYTEFEGIPAPSSTLFWVPGLE